MKQTGQTFIAMAAATSDVGGGVVGGGGGWRGGGFGEGGLQQRHGGAAIFAQQFSQIIFAQPKISYLLAVPHSLQNNSLKRGTFAKKRAAKEKGTCRLCTG